MKKILASVICFMVIITTSTAQYQSFFGVESTSWNGIAPSIPEIILTDSFSYEKDTAINSKAYKKINRFETSSPPVYSHSTFLREDSTLGRLWHLCLSCGDTTERLIIDMSLSVGDTFLSPYPLGFWAYYIVDSVYYNSSGKHIQFDKEIANANQYEIFEFVEGVGTTDGIAYNHFPHTLLCQYKNGSMNYMHNYPPPYQGLCKLNSTLDIQQVLSKKSSTIAPNPAKDNIIIKSNSAVGKMQVQLIDNMGVLVVQRLITSTTDATISLSGLASGLYVVIVRDENHTITFIDKLMIY